jgi:hypothetical protein
MLLWAAVLRRAAYDIALYKRDRRLKFRKWGDDAYRWMFTDDTVTINSFLNLCYFLNQNPTQFRRNTLRLKKKDVHKYDMVESYG